MKTLYGRIADKFKHFGGKKRDEETSQSQTASGSDILEQYRIDTKKIKIENQPFRLSGLLHILTNKISDPLQAHKHHLYYDVDKEVGRYIIGDNDYIEQILRPLLIELIEQNNNAEVILHISKYKEQFIVFDMGNDTAVLPKALLKAYESPETTPETYKTSVETFIKAQKIAEAMGGSLSVKSGKRTGTHFIFKLPYIVDRDNRSNQAKLKNFLNGKRALFIGRTKYDTQRAQYIFGVFGLKIENMKLEDFENKKPQLDKYFMVILRSEDLSPKHITLLKMLKQNKKNDFKLIVIHELFEETGKIEMTKQIADAELFNPTIIGDVEEILYQMFILKSKAVKGISNMQVFDPASFMVVGHKEPTKKDMEYFKGAHIAVAEDSKVDQRVMRNILDVEGVKLFLVGNGEELLKVLRTEEIDIVFTDINMPVMDGITATKEIRSESRWKDLPIISISSMAFGHEIKAMQLAGMNASISKPISAQDVYRALERFLKITPAMQARYAKKIRQQNMPSRYKGDSTVLDVEKGIAAAGGKLQYVELLNETMEVLEDSQEELRKLIIGGEYVALKNFTRSMVSLYTNIHATEMIAMFNEIMMYLSSHSTKSYLSEYILLYAKNRKRLEEEINSFKAYLTDIALA